MRKFLALLFILTSFNCHSIYSQITFEKRYGSPFITEGVSIIKDNSDYTFVGHTTVELSPQTCYIYLAKINQLGDTIFTKKIGTPNEKAYATSIIKTNDDSYLILAYIENSGSNRYPYIIKTKNNGDVIWSTKITLPFNTSTVYKDVVQIPGGYMMVGGYYNSSSCCYTFYLSKMNELGTILWSKTYGGSATNDGMKIKRTLDGNLALLGKTTVTPANSDVFFFKTDTSGNVLWSKTYGESEINNSEGGHTFLELADSSYLIVGYKAAPFTNTGIYILKTDVKGDTLWTKELLDTTASLYSLSIRQTMDKGFCLFGYEYSGEENMLLIKVDSLANVQWKKKYGKNESIGRQIVDVEEKGYTLIGDSRLNTFNNYSKIHIIKTNENGCVLPFIKAKSQGSIITLYPNTFSGLSYEWYFNDSLISTAWDSLNVSMLDGTFKLKVTFIDDCTDSTKIVINNTMLNEIRQERACTIYPNPCFNKLKGAVEDNFIGPAVITIYNSIGQLQKKIGIEKQSQIFNFEIETEELASGFYILNIQLGQNTISKKIIIRN